MILQPYGRLKYHAPIEFLLLIVTTVFVATLGFIEVVANSAIAIIPARGGSKGLTRKNLRVLGGLPLIAHTIRAALKAKEVDSVYVSTEDDEIAHVSEQFGAVVIRRPIKLADDHIQNIDVFEHVLKSAEATATPSQIALLLQPTSPLRTHDHIDACITAFRSSNASSAMSVCEVDHHPEKTIVLDGPFAMPFTDECKMHARRQDLPRVLRQNGAIYIVDVEAFLQARSFYLRPCFAYVMSRSDSVDIDEYLDLLIAEAIINQKLSEKFE